jgi:acyl carrier protein
MDHANALKDRIKAIMVENLMLPVTAADIKDDQPLFGPGSLGLDSVDALQLVVALDKNFGLKIPDPAAAKEILQNVNSIVFAVQKKVAAAAGAFHDLAPGRETSEPGGHAK